MRPFSRTGADKCSGSGGARACCCGELLGVARICWPDCSRAEPRGRVTFSCSPAPKSRTTFSPCVPSWSMTSRDSLDKVTCGSGSKSHWDISCEGHSSVFLQVCEGHACTTRRRNSIHTSRQGGTH
eukprot:1141682-Pelagomonas_calceolata.AAC.1